MTDIYFKKKSEDIIHGIINSIVRNNVLNCKGNGLIRIELRNSRKIYLMHISCKKYVRHKFSEIDALKHYMKLLYYAITLKSSVQTLKLCADASLKRYTSV